jgi:hypothetical protein
MAVCVCVCLYLCQFLLDIFFSSVPFNFYFIVVYFNVCECERVCVCGWVGFIFVECLFDLLILPVVLSFYILYYKF